MPLKLIARIFATIVRAVYAFNQTKKPLLRLDPNHITLTKDLIPKIASPFFSPDMSTFEDEEYNYSNDGLKLDG